MAPPPLPPPLAQHGNALELVPHWIGGRLFNGSGPRLTGFNPATGAATREIALASAAEVDAAGAGARPGGAGGGGPPPGGACPAALRLSRLPHPPSGCARPPS